MPIRRRFDKRRPQLPPVVVAIRDGSPIGYSVDNWQDLIRAAYFHEHGELDPVVQARARALLDAWHDQAYRDEQAERRGGIIRAN